MQFIQWGTFDDSGRPFRVWRVEHACEGTPAKPGDHLYDLGPNMARGVSRFRLVRQGKDGKRTVMGLGADLVARLFPGQEIPSWGAFGRALSAMRDALVEAASGNEAFAESLVDALSGAISSVRGNRGTSSVSRPISAPSEDEAIRILLAQLDSL